jgi:hypothetical protein
MLLLLSLLILLPRGQCHSQCRWYTVGMLLLPSVGVEDDAYHINANRSPATLAHTVCQGLKACALSDRPLLASCAGGKGHNNDGATGGSGLSWIAHQIGMVLPSPSQMVVQRQQRWRAVKAEVTKRAIVMAMRVASNDDDDSNGNGGKCNGNGNEVGG